MISKPEDIKNQTAPVVQMAGGNNNLYPTMAQAAFNAGTMEGLQARQQYTLAEAKNVREEGYLGLARNKDVREEGYLNIAQHADVRAERKLGMEEEAFSWQRQDRNKQQFISSGMAEAFQQGGYSGVIDFLENNDPDKALEYISKKQTLDTQIMKNDVMRTVVPTEKAKAMAEGYKVIGQMATALLQSPEQDREGLYQRMYPILKTVNPSAPRTLNREANDMLVLGMAQAMPANIMFQAQKDQTTSETALGKLDVDIKSRLNRGETVDNSPILATMVQQFQQQQSKLNNSTDTLNGMTYDQIAAQSKANMSNYALISAVNSNYQKESKTFNTFLDNKAAFDGAIKAIQSGAGGAAQTAAYRQVAMMFNKGALSDSDVAAFSSSDATLQQAIKTLKSTAGEEGKIVLNPSEVQRLNILMSNLQTKYSERQQAINNKYSEYKTKYNMSDKDLPMINTASPDRYMMSDVPPELAAQAKSAIDAGADRNAVNARVQQLMGK